VRIRGPSPSGEILIGDPESRLSAGEVAAVDTGADRIEMHRRDIAIRLDDQVTNVSEGRAGQAFDEVRLFLQQELLPLVDAHESHLMPAVERVVGRPHETSSMSLDCEAIRRYVGDIEEIMYKLETGALRDERATLEAELTKKAVRLQAVVELLLEKESKIYLPSLAGGLPEGERLQILEALAAGPRVITLPESERV
jgi:hypothetical protein